MLCKSWNVFKKSWNIIVASKGILLWAYFAQSTSNCFWCTYFLIPSLALKLINIDLWRSRNLWITLCRVRPVETWAGCQFDGLVRQSVLGYKICTQGLRLRIGVNFWLEGGSTTLRPEGRYKKVPFQLFQRLVHEVKLGYTTVRIVAQVS